MSDRMSKVGLVCCISACTAMGDSIIVGINNGGNGFPFGGPVAGSGTEYQEAYSTTDFPGPMSITSIDFLQGFGTLYAGTYTVSLSLITADINSLSNTNLAGNIGSDNTVFTTAVLSGPAPSELVFSGVQPFIYNNYFGNLLLDIQISGGNGTFTGGGFADGNGSGSAGIARYQNFGAGTTGFGLVTQFNFSTGIPEPGTFVLLGCGSIGLMICGRRRVTPRP